MAKLQLQLKPVSFLVSLITVYIYLVLFQKTQRRSKAHCYFQIDNQWKMKGATFLSSTLQVVVLLVFHLNIHVSHSFSLHNSPNRINISIRSHASTSDIVNGRKIRNISNRNSLERQHQHHQQRERQHPSFSNSFVPLSAKRDAVEQQVKDDLNALLQQKLELLDAAKLTPNTKAKKSSNNADSIIHVDDEKNIKAEINTIIQQLEDIGMEENESKDDDIDMNMSDDNPLPRFQPALGLYNVSYVQTKRQDENPVGGKWTRKKRFTPPNLISIRRTMQHLLPVNATTLGQINYNCSLEGGSKSEADQNQNKDDIRTVVAEAVNVITLDVLWNLIRITIILRGDAVPLTTKERYSKTMKGSPLTNLAVRAFFDPPRIVIGRGKSNKRTLKRKRPSRNLTLSLGPKSSVVLDATYVDQNIRIGKGGTSGTRFVFKRCLDGDVEAEEFKTLLLAKPTKKKKLLASILFAMIASSSTGFLFGTRGGGQMVNNQFLRFNTVVGRFVSIITSFLFIGVLFSTGGIEQDNQETSR